MGNVDRTWGDCKWRWHPDQRTRPAPASTVHYLCFVTFHCAPLTSPHFSLLQIKKVSWAGEKQKGYLSGKREYVASRLDPVKEREPRQTHRQRDRQTRRCPKKDYALSPELPFYVFFLTFICLNALLLSPSATKAAKKKRCWSNPFSLLWQTVVKQK